MIDEHRIQPRDFIRSSLSRRGAAALAKEGGFLGHDTVSVAARLFLPLLENIYQIPDHNAMDQQELQQELRLFKEADDIDTVPKKRADKVKAKHRTGLIEDKMVFEPQTPGHTQADDLDEHSAPHALPTLYGLCDFQKMDGVREYQSLQGLLKVPWYQSRSILELGMLGARQERDAFRRALSSADPGSPVELLPTVPVIPSILPSRLLLRSLRAVESKAGYIPLEHRTVAAKHSRISVGALALWSTDMKAPEQLSRRGDVLCANFQGLLSSVPGEDMAFARCKRSGLTMRR